MADLMKDHPYSDFTEHPATTEEEKESEEQQTPVVKTRLRDRELLKKRKAEVQERETFEDQNKHKRQRKGRGTGRRRATRQTKEPQVEAEPEEIQDSQAENGQIYLEHKEEPAVIVLEATGIGTQHESVEYVPQSTAHTEVPERDPEPETADVLGLPLDSTQAEDEYYIPLL